MNCRSHLLLVLLCISSTAGLAFPGSGDVSWKEEVLLHDGRQLVVLRSQTYGGRHEIGQKPPIREQAISFEFPNSGARINWSSTFSEDLGRVNLNPIALHILGNAAFVVTKPNLCLSFNKWGRPNPPYVVFKHDGNGWQRIALEALPIEFQNINLTVDTKNNKKVVQSVAIVSSAVVRKLNAELEQPEYRAILRKPLLKSQICPAELTGFKAPYPAK